MRYGTAVFAAMMVTMQALAQAPVAAPAPSWAKQAERAAQPRPGKIDKPAKPVKAVKLAREKNPPSKKAQSGQAEAKLAVSQKKPPKKPRA